MDTKERAKLLFKSFQGFNTDVLKPGVALYAHIILKNGNSCERDMVIQGNVLVTHSEPLRLHLRTVDMEPIVYHDHVAKGTTVIKELRVLK
jgi:hypothetical protein